MPDLTWFFIPAFVVVVVWFLLSVVSRFTGDDSLD